MMTRSRRSYSLHAVIALSSVAAACRTTAPEAGADAGARGTGGCRRCPPICNRSRRCRRITSCRCPLSVVAGTGAPFTLTAATSIVVPAGNTEVQRIAEQLAMIVRTSTAFANPITQSDAAAPAGAIVLRLGGPASLGNEGL